MKRLLLLLILTLATAGGIKAMSYEQARREAWFLTDKMAYELNLTPTQFDCAYRVNLDYLMSINTASDCYGYYWSYRETTCVASCLTGNMPSIHRSTISTALCAG